MFNSKVKKEALENLQKAAVAYQTAHDNTIFASSQLHEARKKSVDLMKTVICFQDSLSNVPSELTDKAGKAQHNIGTFEATVKAFQGELDKVSTGKDSNAGVGLMIGGVAAGIGVAVGGPAAAMAIATTFGVASTGVAISSLSGAAATSAVLAWLGGSAVAAGVAGGSTVLAVFGPIGLVLAAGCLTAGGFLQNRKNKKIAAEANGKTTELKNATARLQKIVMKINGLYNETVQSEMKIRYIFEGNFSEGKTSSDYSVWKNEQQTKFVDLINETEELSEKILRTI